LPNKNPCDRINIVNSIIILQLKNGKEKAKRPTRKENSAKKNWRKLEEIIYTDNLNKPMGVITQIKIEIKTTIFSKTN